MKPQDMVALCRECAGAIYGTRPPNPGYAEAAAKLLAGTAATESQLQYRRQHGLSWERDVGAWGLWQSEAIALYDNIAYLANRHDVGARAAEFCWGIHGSAQIWQYMLPAKYDASDPLMRVAVRRLYAEDRLAVVMARVHYLRQPSAIPRDLRGQAAYWKQHYNTISGAGTPEKYLENFHYFIGGLFDESD